MVPVRVGKGGARFDVRAQPRASRNAIVGCVGARLKVAVTASPTDGRANAAIQRVLAEALAVRPSAVRIAAGLASRDKTVEMEELSVRDVQRRLEALLSCEGENTPNPRR